MANSVSYNSVTGETTINLDQGTYFEHTFHFKVGEDDFDLTNYSARMQVRKTYGSTSTIYSATTANGKIPFVSQVGGTMKVVFQPADTSLVRFNAPDDSTLDCVFDIELENTISGKVYKPVRGTLVLNREVTR